MNPTIERLRREAESKLKATEAQRPSKDQIASICAGLVNCDRLEEIAKKADLTPGRVLDIIGELGTWIKHSNKKAMKASIRSADEGLEETLFLGPWSHQFPDEVVAPKRKRKKSYISYDTLTVTVPEGFTSKENRGRDVSKALAAIVVSPPDANTISRFISRAYSTRSATLTYAIVSGVWYMARLGRLDTIDKVNAKDPVFHMQVVLAYDLLQVARLEAIEKLDEILTIGSSDLVALKDACVGARWIAEREVTKIERLIEVALARENGMRLLENELSFFKSRVNANPALYRPAALEDLTVGQVQRITQNAGIAVAGASREEESRIRAQLKKLGLAGDLDQLLPEGLRAAQHGKLDDFWVIMNARVEGDDSWTEALEELLLEQRA